jgi:hypothetical protein
MRVMLKNIYSPEGPRQWEEAGGLSTRKILKQIDYSMWLNTIEVSWFSRMVEQLRINLCENNI